MTQQSYDLLALRLRIGSELVQNITAWILVSGFIHVRFEKRVSLTSHQMNSTSPTICRASAENCI